MNSTPTSPAGARPGGAKPSSPESLDAIIATTRPRGWLALWAIAGMVLAVLVWSIVATIPQQKSATGIVSPYLYAHEVTATTEGTFFSEAMSATAGGQLLRSLSAGDVLGAIDPYDGSSPVDVVAPVDGVLQSVYVTQGQGVEPGTALALMYATPDVSAPMPIITWVPLSTAYPLTVGETATVTVNDVSTGQDVTTTATIQAISETPSSVESMTTVSGDPALADQWSSEAGGQPYRVDLSLDLADWPSSSPRPTPGSVVNIVATYAEIHPIQMLFGGAS